MDKIPHGFRPCLSCTRSCYQEHWPLQSRDTFRSPCFMRALCDSNLAAMATCWMVIPSAWLKLHGDEVGNSAVLHGPSGNTWQVGVGRPKWVAFRVGWRTFAADNGLEKGDILVFTLIGKSEFAVRIFDNKTGLEKESALTATNTGCYDSKSPSSLGVKRKQRDDDENAAELKRICAHNNGVQLVHNDQSIDSTHTEKVLQQRRAKSSTFSSAAALISYGECALLDLNSQPLYLHQNPTSGNGNFFPEIDHQLLDAVVARTFQGYASGIVYQPHPISIRSQDVGEECHVQGQSKAQVCGSGGLGPATRFASQRRPVMDARERSTEFPHRQNNSPTVIPSHHRSQILDLNKEHFSDDVVPHMLSPDVILEREKALELARRAQESIDRPSHLVVLRAFHVHGRAFVRFPVTFGKQHMPRKTVSMHLLDSHGHRWPMTWLRDNETHMGLTRGWRDFCLAEGLLEGDVCIFELIELNKLTLLIHVFRSSETRDSNHVIITKPKRPELLQMQHLSHKKCSDRKRKVVDKGDGRRQRKADSLADKDALPTSSEGQYPCTPTKLALYKAFHRTTHTDSVGPSRVCNRRQDSFAAGSVGRERLKKLSLWASKVQGGMYSSSKKISCESESVAGTSLERCCKDDEELTDSVMSKTQDATFSEILCQMSSGCVGANNSRNCRNSPGWVRTSTLSTGLIEKDEKSSAVESRGFECQHFHEQDCTRKRHHINAARRHEIRGGSGKLVSNTFKHWAKARKRCETYGKTEETRTWGWKWYTPDYSVLRRRMQVLNRNSRFYIASRRTPVTDAQKEAAKEAALAMKTENPATMVVLKSSNVYKTYIVEILPEFCRQLSPNERVHIFLRDAAGNKTRVLLTQEALTKGWRQFSLEHLLEEGDVCVFELIDTSRRTILVHIFRVVDVDYINGNYRNHYRIISAGFQRTQRPLVKCGLKIQANGQVVNEVATKLSFQARRNSVNRSLYLAILKTRDNLRKPRPVEDDNPYYTKEHMDLNLDLDTSTVPPPALNTLWDSPSCTMSTSCASRSPVLKLYPELDSALMITKNDSSQLCPMSDSLLRLPVVTPPSSGTALADICEISSCKNRQQQTMLYPENDTMVGMPLPLPPDEDDSEPEEGNYYRVVRILKKRYFDNEKQYLAELDGPVVQSDGCRGVREYDDMKWWIPEKSFSPGFTSCYLR